MHVVAEATGGTFSFIENEAVIQDAFAQCIGGLLTVVVQEARVPIACVHPGVRISSVKSGRYESRVDEDGRSASIAVGELYADEERRFLLFLAVPTAEAADGGESETLLLKARCSYREAAGGTHVDVAAEDTVVARPERERARVEAIEDMAAARAAAERGAHQEAAEILGNRGRAMARAAERGGRYPQRGAANRGVAHEKARGEPGELRAVWARVRARRPELARAAARDHEAAAPPAGCGAALGGQRWRWGGDQLGG
jgi:hypothetical protein